MVSPLNCWKMADRSLALQCCRTVTASKSSKNRIFSSFFPISYPSMCDVHWEWVPRLGAVPFWSRGSKSWRVPGRSRRWVCRPGSGTSAVGGWAGRCCCWSSSPNCVEPAPPPSVSAPFPVVCTPRNILPAPSPPPTWPTIVSSNFAASSASPAWLKCCGPTTKRPFPTYPAGWRRLSPRATGPWPALAQADGSAYPPADPTASRPRPKSTASNLTASNYCYCCCYCCYCCCCSIKWKLLTGKSGETSPDKITISKLDKTEQSLIMGRDIYSKVNQLDAVFHAGFD